MGNDEQINSIERILGKIEERVENMIERIDDNRLQNDKEHKDIFSAVKQLTIHVNHENELMQAEIKKNKEEANKRICDIEDQHQNEKAEKKGQEKIYKAVSAVLGTIITVMTILHFCGLF